MGRQMHNLGSVVIEENSIDTPLRGFNYKNIILKGIKNKLMKGDGFQTKKG